MIQTNHLSRSYKHANSIEYTGVLSKVQTENTSRYQDLKVTSEYQNLLYERAMFGLGVYSTGEIQNMSSEKRKRIVKVHKRTKKIINLWKQEIIIALSDHLFNTLFPKMPLAMSIVNDYREDVDYHCKMNLSDFGITKKDIISKLVSENMLPKQVFTLKPI